MGFEKEKRKNDDPRRFPWRSVLLLVIGFTLGVIVTMLFTPSSNRSTVYFSSSDDNHYLTATRVVEQATNMAQGIFLEPNNAQQAAQTDPIYITATFIIDRATQTAQAMGTPPAQP